MTDDDVVLSARDVEVRYGTAPRPALTEASLDLRRGEAVGLVGESGSGKSTFAKVLAGALAPTRGTVTIDGESWTAVGRRDPRRRRVQMIFQDPYGCLNPLVSVLDAVAEVHEVWDGLRRREARLRAAEGLEHVGLSSQFHRATPRRLSGGQCQRVGIARALACQPDVLIADEPTSALDVSIQASILNLLMALRQERNLALVLVSHDLAVVRYLTDATLVLYSGEIVERGSTVDLLSNPRHPYTDLLLASVSGDRVEEPRTAPAQDGACAFTSRCPRATDLCVSVRPELSSTIQAARCHFPLHLEGPAGPSASSERPSVENLRAPSMRDTRA